MLVPVVCQLIEPALGGTLGRALPLFQGPPYGVGMLSAGLVLAIMILPTIAAISRDVLLAVPREQREGLLALGATRWEVISTVVVPYARAGILGGVAMADVLVVEDEQSLLQTLRYNLSRAGHAVRLCTDGRVTLEISKVLGLEVGADDYSTKRFSMHELLARVKAQLRRADRDGFRLKAPRDHSPPPRDRLMRLVRAPALVRLERRQLQPGPAQVQATRARDSAAGHGCEMARLKQGLGRLVEWTLCEAQCRSWRRTPLCSHAAFWADPEAPRYT